MGGVFDSAARVAVLARPQGKPRRVTPMSIAINVRPSCSCAKHADGSVTVFLCPLHASDDPCLAMSRVTGKRRTGTIRGGVCTACGWAGPLADQCAACNAEPGEPCRPGCLGYALEHGEL